MSNEKQLEEMEESNDETISTSDDDVVKDGEVVKDVNVVLDDNVMEKYLKLSAEEINRRINTYQNLCTGNKVNTTNAFDIDMIEYFASWLEKKNSLQSNGYGSFQEVSEYLEVSAKIYSLRVDNVTESTGKLAEKFRSINSKTTALDTECEKDQLKLPQPKRPKIMLTTSEKLKSKADNFIDPSTKLGNHDIDWNELFEKNYYPSNYLSSIYFNYSLKEEKQKAVQPKNNKINFFPMSDFKDELNKRVICPEFHDFDAEEINNAEEIKKELKIEGIEYHFDPEFNNFNNILGNGQLEECDPNFDDNNRGDIDTLSDCVDNVRRDYSFFNPLLLSRWKAEGKGNQAWKTRTMVKSLKSCKPNEREQVLSFSNYFNDIQELTQEKLNPKITTKRTKKKENEVKITWKSLEEIQLPQVKKNEKLMSKTINKWFLTINTFKISQDSIDTKIKFDFLNYYEIEPDWMIPEENMSNNSFKSSPNYQNVEACDLIDLEEKEILEEETKFNEFIQKLSKSNESKGLPSGGNDVFKELITEERTEFRDLKKEIFKIIDQECTEIDSDNGMYGKLPFSNLLKKLNLQEKGGPSVAVVFVGLLHLSNEFGLKLQQEPSTAVKDIKEFYIFKPLNKI